jgi:hypothetical protein
LLYCKIRCPGNEINQKGSLVCSCVLPLRHCKAEAVVGDGLFRVTNKIFALVFKKKYFTS